MLHEEIDSQKVYQYLVEEWRFKVADEFTEHLYSKIYKLTENPFTGAPASRRRLSVSGATPWWRSWRCSPRLKSHAQGYRLKAWRKRPTLVRVCPTSAPVRQT